jgi:gamma-glutamylcyclotransferase (GGCT)/AIG2-like uncharacterized protein YtfP
MADLGIYHLFVYGSLRSGFRSPAYDYISSYFDLVGEAKVKGKLFDMGEYPAGIPTDENVFILGELYLIKNEPEFSWAIGQLDDYDGVTAEPGESQIYRREREDILIGDKTVPGWIFWYNGDVSGKPQIMSGDVLAYMNQKK